MDESLKGKIVTGGLSLIPIGTAILQSSTDIKVMAIGASIIIIGGIMVGGGMYLFFKQMQEKLGSIRREINELKKRL